MKTIKKLLLAALIGLTLVSCSTDDSQEETKTARVNTVSLYNLPTSVSVNDTPLSQEFHNGEAFEVETGDVIKASGRQI
jgi:hypothetical protein